MGTAATAARPEASVGPAAAPAGPARPVSGMEPHESGLARLRRALHRVGVQEKAIRSGSDRRAHTRFELESRGTATLIGRFSDIPFEVLDISTHGIQFCIREPVAVGEQLLLTVCLPHMAPARVAALARRVTWVTNKEGRVYKVGAQFL